MQFCASPGANPDGLLLPRNCVFAVNGRSTVEKMCRSMIGRSARKPRITSVILALLSASARHSVTRRSAGGGKRTIFLSLPPLLSPAGSSFASVAENESPSCTNRTAASNNACKTVLRRRRIASSNVLLPSGSGRSALSGLRLNSTLSPRSRSDFSNHSARGAHQTLVLTFYLRFHFSLSIHMHADVPVSVPSSSSGPSE